VSRRGVAAKSLSECATGLGRLDLRRSIVGLACQNRVMFRFRFGFLWWVLVAAASVHLHAKVPPTRAPQVESVPAGVLAAEAARRAERARLATLRDGSAAAGDPLAQWVHYFDLSSRLESAAAAEVEAFFSRWPGTYVEDRLRNDWLLELGRRRDWAGFSREYPRFRMDDDRQVHCHALHVRHLAGEAVRDNALSLWHAQREPDEACMALATALHEARQIGPSEVWQALRLAVQAQRPRVAQAVAGLLGEDVAREVRQLLDKPAPWLQQRATSRGRSMPDLRVLAVMRLASADPEAAVRQMREPWARGLPLPLEAAAWAAIGRQHALRRLPQATSWYGRAFELWRREPDAQRAVPWHDETLAWAVRAALRAPADEATRWPLVRRAVEAMPAPMRDDPAWVYWHARALEVMADPGAAGDADRVLARQARERIASPFHFYGKLAAEDLDRPLVLPPAPSALTPGERSAAAAHPGLQRGLALIALGLRSEGVREWNFSLRGMGDRELLAAAQLACDREVWDRCINTSDRTRQEIDLAQRFPMPFRDQVAEVAGQIGVDPAYIYGLIRQESRFIMDARSHVGASGLMQLMPATAQWTARRIGMDFRPEMITDRDVNLRLGTTYLKLVLEDFGGSVALAAAAYNAGPSRSRRWREGPEMEVAAWAETIPFNETRDYVKKVLSNSALYAVRLTGADRPALKARMGLAIGPRNPDAAPVAGDLP
jgi:soluble lytic murein transglycosylase